MKTERGLFPPINVESEPPQVVETLFPRRLDWFRRRRRGPRLKFLRMADYWFSDAPPKLICRFFLEIYKDLGWVVLRVERFPPAIAARAQLADACCLAIRDAHGSHWSPIAHHTAEEVKQIYAQSRRQAREEGREQPVAEFDLHDVYVCMEAQLMDLYGRRLEFDIHPPEWYDEGMDELEYDPAEPGAIMRDELNRQAEHACELLEVIGTALG